MNREEKKQSITVIKDMVENNSAAMIVYYHGLTAGQIHGLRGLLLDSGAKMKVIKNSLAKLAIANLNTKGLENFLTGPTALIVSNDPVAMVKNLTKFAKENASLLLVGGLVDNQVVDKKAIGMLADMPSKDELRATIVGLLTTPATELVRLLNAPATQVARVMSAYSEK